MISNPLDLLDSTEKGASVIETSPNNNCGESRNFFSLQKVTNTRSVSIKERTTQLLIIHVKSVVTEPT